MSYPSGCQNTADEYGNFYYGNNNTSGDQAYQVRFYEPPIGHIIDCDGRLLNDPRGLLDPDTLPEDDLNAYVSKWQAQIPSPIRDWHWSSKVVWPEVSHVVALRRLDFYELAIPRLHVVSADLEESRRLRACGDYIQVFTLFSADFRNPLTVDLVLESTGPPRRSRFRPINKQNNRDTSKWVEVTRLPVFHGVAGVQGAVLCYVDYQDFPDRYFLSFDEHAAIGCRRTFQFGAYSATQYYIIEKQVEHELLDSEGGKGISCTVAVGPICYARKDYNLVGSFFGFHAQLPGSSKYTVYQRIDPFPRMMISMSVIERDEEWPEQFSFYAFDIPIPHAVRYSVHHSIRSIHTNRASIPRHRLTTDDPRTPWEFRMHMYVMPAALEDVTIFPYPNDDPYFQMQEQLRDEGLA
jgi:hypothetical protein